jgi:hypothetical protein
MPRLFNAENCLFQTFAVASLASNATATATMTGLATTDYVMVLNHDDVTTTAQAGIDAWVSAANTLVFRPTGSIGTTDGGTSSVAQTVGVLAMVAPTSGVEGGSW